MNRPNEDEDATLTVDSDEETFRKRYDSRIEPPSVAVVSLVAAVTDHDPTELDPLNDVIDPDALDALFEPTPIGRFRGDGRVAFSYHGLDVTVYSYGVVEIEVS